MVGKVISHYRILEKLGGGGMGEVYKAEDIKLKRTVALKFLPLYFSLDEEAKQRFIQEARTASSLDHPNICTIYEIDETGNIPGRAPGRLFIAMAYYQGATLKKRIVPRLMNQGEVINIAIQVAGGLSKAHQQGILHRDIKPANVMVTDEGIAKIVDFGLARLAGRSEITRPEMTMGTLSYISPEQIKGERIDHRSDIWSYGVMLYEMLTGELPFKGDIDQAIIYSILNEAPEPLKFNISEHLKRVIMRSLEKDPEDRYRNMEEMIAELQAVEKETGPIQMDKAKPSIAVLPFKNMSEDEGQEYFCDGMAEEIINALTQIHGLKVIARTSSFMFKKKEMDIREIGRKLNVDMILEGSVRKSNGRLRIMAQLIRVLDGCHVWSDKFDRNLHDVLEIQDEISLSIVDKLKIRLLENDKKKLTLHRTENLEAYNLYLLGRFYWAKNSKADLEKSIEYYYKAVEKDDNYLLVYYGIVSSYASLRFYGHSLNVNLMTRARDAAEKAVKIDPDTVATHLTLAIYHMNFTWDWEKARGELEKVKEIDPNNIYMRHIYSGYYSIIGDLKNAILEEELAQEFDPLRIECILRLGIYYIHARHTDKARQQFLKVKEMEPNYFFSYWMLGQTYILESNYNEGIELLEEALMLSNNSTIVLGDLGRAYALAGNRYEAINVLNELKKRIGKENVHPFSLTVLYASLRELDEAFLWLEKAYEERDPAILHLLTVETIDNLREDPRFEEIVKKMGLLKYYKADGSKLLQQ